MGFPIMLLYSSVALLVCTAVAIFLRMRAIEKLIGKIPGPTFLPVLGNSLMFAGVKNVEDLWSALMQALDKGRGIQRLWLGPVLSIVVDDPAFVNLVLTHSASKNKHPWYNVLSFGKNGIFISNGKHYEMLRKCLSTTLHPKNVTNLHGLVAAKAKRAAAVLDEKVGQGEFDVSELTSTYTLDLVCNGLLGADINEMEENKFNFRDTLGKATAISFQRVFKPQYFNDYIFQVTPTGQKFEKYSWEINTLTRQILEKRIRELESKGIDLKSDFEYEYYTDSIIKIGNEEGFSLAEMAKMLLDIPVGGSETSAVTAAFMLLYLAMYPQYQQEAYEEQIAVLGDTDRAPSVKELGRMPFLSGIEKEVHRLHGPPLIARYTDEEMVLGGHTIPRGTTIAILIHKLHRNPQYYERPDEFDPRRFSPENVANLPKNCHIPFSAGHRRCPGSLLAHLLVVTLVSVLLRRYKFTTSMKAREMKLKFSFMLELSQGYPVEITRRV